MAEFTSTEFSQAEDAVVAKIKRTRKGGSRSKTGCI